MRISIRADLTLKLRPAGGKRHGTANGPPCYSPPSLQRPSHYHARRTLHVLSAACRPVAGLQCVHDARLYGHLRFKETPLIGVILAAWGIAFIEYCLAVPANRWGSAVYSTAELKTMQEIITLAVFAVFSVVYLKESFGWNHAVGFSLIALGAFFVLQKW
jgi:uncharacterized protein (DUF486 family)